MVLGHQLIRLMVLIQGMVKFAPMNNSMPFEVRNEAMKAIIDLAMGADSSIYWSNQ